MACVNDPETGTHCQNQLELDFFRTLFAGQAREALLIAARGVINGQLYTYHLEIAVREIDRQAQIEAETRR